MTRLRERAVELLTAVLNTLADALNRATAPAPVSVGYLVGSPFRFAIGKVRGGYLVNDLATDREYVALTLAGAYRIAKDVAAGDMPYWGGGEATQRARPSYRFLEYHSGV